MFLNRLPSNNFLFVRVRFTTASAPLKVCWHRFLGFQFSEVVLRPTVQFSSTEFADWCDLRLTSLLAYSGLRSFGVGHTLSVFIIYELSDYGGTLDQSKKKTEPADCRSNSLSVFSENTLMYSYLIGSASPSLLSSFFGWMYETAVTTYTSFADRKMAVAMTSWSALIGTVIGYKVWT